MRTLQERFNAKYVPEPNSGCWLWLGALMPNGYGRFEMHRFDEYAHRASWILHRGAITDGLYVLHKCDIPSCVNPDHLFLGTQQDNLDDCRMKGRTRRGAQVWNAKLDDDKVRAIRKLLSLGVSQQAIADKFGVHQIKISHIARGISWRHVTNG
jgi:hypothetical protein